MLDEPVSALGASVQERTLRLLAELEAGPELTYLIISHGLTVVRQISPRVEVMYRGQTLESGPCAEGFKAPKDAHTRIC